MLAYDYPLLDVFVTMVAFIALRGLALAAWSTSWGTCSETMSTAGGQGGWIVFLVVLPYIGVLTYIVVRGHGMGLRELERPGATRRSSPTPATAGSGPADELAKLADLRPWCALRGRVQPAEGEDPQLTGQHPVPRTRSSGSPGVAVNS